MNTLSTEYEARFVPEKSGIHRQFYLRPSRYLARVLVIAASAVFILLLLLPLSGWVYLALNAVLLISVAYYLQHDAYLSMQTSCVHMRVDADKVTVTRRNGQSWSGLVLHDSFIAPQMVILNILPGNSYFSRRLLIFPDSLEKDSFRQLRVLMKWGR